MPKWIPDLPGLTVIILMALYVLTFSAISIRQHDTFLTNKEDLGQIDQTLWNSLHGRPFVVTDNDHQSTRLADHVEPMMIASSLVFMLWDDVRALLVLQAVAAALGAWAIFLLARDVLESTGEWGDAKHRPIPLSPWRKTQGLIPIAFALLYLLFPALEAPHLAEYHAAPLASAPLAFALLFLERRQWLRFLFVTLLVAAVKEEMALIGLMLSLAGLLILIADRKRISQLSVARLTTARPSPLTDARVSGPARPSVARLTNARPFAYPLTAIILCLAWFFYATFVVVPYFGAAKYGSADSVYFERFGALGANPAAVVKTLLTNPTLVARVLFTPEKLGYIGGLLASTGFLALAAPEVLLIGAPLLAANLLSNFPAQYSGDFHYSVALVPIFTAAAIYGLSRVGALRRSDAVASTPYHAPRVPYPLSRLLLPAALVCILLYHHARGYTPLSENFYFPEITPHQQSFARFAAQIPPAATLSATPSLFPHLSHRELIYVFPTVASADYLLLDAAGVTDMHPNDFRNAVNALLSGGQYGVLDSADGYILLKRGAPVSALPEAFYDFARAPAAEPQYRTDVVFGDALKLIGYDVRPDPRWHRVRTRWYWQALRPLDADLRLWPFYHDAAGNVLEDTSQRPLVATLWYSPARWQVGETIVAETLAWDVGDAFSLAVGVMHGNDWDRKGRRLATPSDETQLELGAFVWQGKALLKR